MTLNEIPDSIDITSYENLQKRFRYHWEEGRKRAREVGECLNGMVTILLDKNPDWSIKKCAYKIALDNQDLDGFSKSTIYNNLDSTNRTLLDSSKQNRKVLEESVPDSEQKIIEDSSNPTEQIPEVTSEIYQSGLTPQDKLETLTREKKLVEKQFKEATKKIQKLQSKKDTEQTVPKKEYEKFKKWEEDDTYARKDIIVNGRIKFVVDKNRPLYRTEYESTGRFRFTTFLPRKIY